MIMNVLFDNLVQSPYLLYANICLSFPINPS